MLANLVTEVSAEQPVVVLIGDNSALLVEISKIFSNKNIPVVGTTLKNASGEISRFSGEIYKIVWIHDSTSPIGGEKLVFLSEILQKIQRPIIQIFPIITPIKNLKVENENFNPWLQLSINQKSQILGLNSVLSESKFIFIQDLVLEKNHSPSNAMFFCTSQVESDETLLDPEINFSPTTITDIISKIEENLLKPVMSSSVLIKGKPWFSTDLLKRVKQKYFGHHNRDLRIIMSPVEMDEAVPFSTIDVELDNGSSDIDVILSRLLHYPTPKLVVGEAVASAVVKAGNRESNKEEVRRIGGLGAREVVGNEVQREPVVVKSQQHQEPTTTTTSKSRLELNSRASNLEPVYIKPIKPIPPKETNENLDISLELQKIFKAPRVDKKTDKIVKTAKKQQKIKKKTKSKKGLFYGGIVVIVLGITTLLLALVFFVNQFLLKNQATLAVRELIDNQAIEEQTQQKLELYNSALSNQLKIYNKIFDTSLLAQASSLLELSEELSSITENLTQARESVILYTANVLGIDVGGSSEYAQKLAHSAQKMYNNLSLIQSRLGQVSLSVSSEETESYLNQLTEKIQELRDALGIEKQLHQFLPTIFGQNGRKTYALILQNDQELRPTGGFIEAVALLRFENGSLISTDTYSSYELDKKMVGMVSPPEEIKQFLSEKQWFLRDSNWDPNFPSTAKKIAWFIKKEEGVDVDGVIALNTKSLGALIEALGPIDIPQYNETLTNRNLAERMEFHSEVVLVESAKTEYYPKVVLTSVLNRLTSIQPEKTSTVLSTLYQQLQSHQISISFFDNSQEVISTLGWGGEIINPACPVQISSPDCVVDEIAQVEANIGVNKANYYLRRSIEHSVQLENNFAKHTRIIKYENTAQSNAWPKGSYRAYIRFYLPHSSQLTEVKFDGENIPIERLIQREEGGRPVVGLPIEIPTNQTKRLEVDFVTPIPEDNKLSYAFFDQKQSGIENISELIAITPRKEQQPEIIAPQAEIKNGEIVFSQQPNNHTFVGVRFK